MSTTTTIHLVRHPESESNRCLTTAKKDVTRSEMNSMMNQFNDPDITELGSSQARVKAPFIKSLGPHAVLRSPFKRTKYLSELCLPSDKMIIEVHDELLEYNPPSRSNCFHKDKTFASFVRRVVAYYMDVLQLRSEPVLIVVGHSLFISVLLSYISLRNVMLGAKVETVISLLTKLKNTGGTFHIQNCGVVSIVSDGNTSRIQINA